MKSSQKLLLWSLSFAESVDVLQISQLFADRMNSLTHWGKYPYRGPADSSPCSS